MDDIALIWRANGLLIGNLTDPRDPDRNLKINGADALRCALRCDRFLCRRP